MSELRLEKTFKALSCNTAWKFYLLFLFTYIKVRVIFCNDELRFRLVLTINHIHVESSLL